MGLDQYAFSRKAGTTDNKAELMYWRKHANLEGWMRNLYYQRGGEGEFNCVDLRLFEGDVENLEKEYLDLEHSEGFFWGNSRPEQNDDTMEFIRKAYKAIRAGDEVVYTSWW